MGRVRASDDDGDLEHYFLDGSELVDMVRTRGRRRRERRKYRAKGKEVLWRRGKESDK